jgi:hypothetical protein
LLTNSGQSRLHQSTDVDVIEAHIPSPFHPACDLHSDPSFTNITTRTAEVVDQRILLRPGQSGNEAVLFVTVFHNYR